MTIEEENGQMLLSRYGNTFALGFKGDAGFLERSYNLAYNFCMTDGSLMPLAQDMSYIITSPVKIMKALELYYYNLVIMNKEINITFDDEGEIHIDEDAAKKLSLEKAQKFFETKIVKENFMFNQFLKRRLEFSEFK